MDIYTKWLGWMLGFFFLIVVVASVMAKFLVIDPVYNSRLFILNEASTTLIIGASHSATSMHTEYLDKSINVAKSAEPLFFTYYKAKALLKNNPHIEHLVVAVSPLHISKYSAQQLFQGNAGSRESAMAYYFLVDDVSDPLINTFSSDNIIAYLKFKWGVPFNYMSDLKVVFNYYRNNIVYSEYSFFGGEESFKGNRVAEYRQKAKSDLNFYGENKKPSISDSGKEAIRRIADLSDQFNVSMTIISTPTHPYYRSLRPALIEKEYRGLIAAVLAKHNNIVYYDYADFALSESDYLDADHLNTNGAAKFSRYLQAQGIFNLK
jgi:hypothetical protein